MRDAAVFVSLSNTQYPVGAFGSGNQDIVHRKPGSALERG